MSALIKEKRTASIIADGEVKALKLPGESIFALIKSHPDLALKICKMLAERVREATALSQDTAEERNVMRHDVASQHHHALELVQKIFILLAAVQKQFQIQQLKPVIEFIMNDKLFSAPEKLQYDEEFLRVLSDDMRKLVVQAFPKPEKPGAKK